MISKRVIDQIGGAGLMQKLNKAEGEMNADEPYGLCPFCVEYGWNFSSQACERCGEAAET